MNETPPTGTPLTDLATLVEIKSLIDKASRIESRLAENERQILSELRNKYAGPCEIGFEDKTLLEVLLRNVAIRRQKGIGPG